MRVSGISAFSSEPLSLGIEGSAIVDRKVLAEAPEGGDFLSPGLIDIQVNGYKGVDYSSENLSAGQVSDMVKYLAPAGITQHFPTIITSSRKRIARNLEVIRLAREGDDLIRAAIPGVHIEGPYISGLDGPRGTHDAAFIRDPDFDEFKEWQEASGNLVAIVTVAPERAGAIKFIEEVSSTGVVVAIGHTSAAPDQISKAIAAGARLSTHLGNGSATSIPRLRNFLWPQLASDALYASIIADGYHLPAEVVKIYRRAKGLDRLILISDISPLGGFPKGIYHWGNVEAAVFDDGHLGLPDTEILAGAAHQLDWDIPHFMKFTGVRLGNALRLCTENPARFLGLAHASREFKAGEPANLIVFGYAKGRDRLRIARTIIGGRTVFEMNA